MNKQPNRVTDDVRPKRKSKKESKTKGEKEVKKSKKRQIPIKYEKPQFTDNEAHAIFVPQIESVDIANDKLTKSDEEKYSSKELKSNEKYFDEVEMKSHGFVDKKGQRMEVAMTKDADSGQPAHIPFDEVAMKKCGFVDDHGHHMTENEIHPNQNEVKRPHVNVISVVEAVSLREPTETGSTEAASNEELLVTLRDSIHQCENLLNELKFKHEYIEYRVGEKCRAMAVWPDGSEDNYEFTGDTVYQITREQT